MNKVLIKEQLNGSLLNSRKVCQRTTHFIAQYRALLLLPIQVAGKWHWPNTKRVGRVRLLISSFSSGAVLFKKKKALCCFVAFAGDVRSGAQLSLSE